MLTRSRCCGICLALLPAVAAMANPVDISMEGRGAMYPYNPLLAVFGMSAVPDTSPQSYSVAISAVMDAAAPGVYSDPRISLFEQFQTQVTLRFQFGSQHYEYKGAGDVLVEAGSQYYERISFALPGAPDVQVFAENEVQADGIRNYPTLAPPAIGGANGAPAVQGASAVYAFFGPIDDANYITMSAQTQDVLVTSVPQVPEPASAAMWTAGLLVLLVSAVRVRP